MHNARCTSPMLLVPLALLLANCTQAVLVTQDASDVQAAIDAPPEAAPPADVVSEARDVVMDTYDAGPPIAECASSAIINLNAVGTMTDVVTHYTASNATAPATGGLTAPSCQSAAGHPVVFRYTAHASATLRFSTNSAATTFDTVVWALDRCSNAGAMELGCIDDDGDGANPSASTLTTSFHANAGQAVYFVVAGTGDATGSIDITVAELRDVPVGSSCDATGATTICTPAPATCVTAAGTSRCEMPSYMETGMPTPMFLDACASGVRATLVARTGADARNDGHSTTGVVLPFAFRFFGNAVTTVWPSTNGYAVFDAVPTDINGGDLSIPMPEEGALVAPFWQNLVLRASPGSDICTAVFGTAPNRQFAIEWLDAMPSGDTTTHVTFEAVLDEGTNNIDFVYRQLDPGMSPSEESDGSWSAIGVQSNHGERSVVHTGSVDTMNGVRFTP